MHLQATVALELQYSPPDMSGMPPSYMNGQYETDAPPMNGEYPLEHLPPMDQTYDGDSYIGGPPPNREKERRGSFISVSGGTHAKSSKSQSMVSLQSSDSRRRTDRKESMPASIGSGGRYITPNDSSGLATVASPFDQMLKGANSSRRGSQISMHSDRSVSMKCNHAHPRVREEKKMSVKEQDYQIQVRILEARQLAGTQIDPVATVNVGNQKKSTTVKEQTNCPFWDEFFVYDFKMPPMVLFDKIICFQVFTGRNLVSQGTLVGSFKLDVGTVYAQPDHRFCRRWAVLTDPDETLGASGAGVKVGVPCLPFQLQTVYQ